MVNLLNKLILNPARQIKTSIFLMLAIFCFFIIGCISDDNERVCAADFKGDLTENETALVGQWMLTGIVSEKEVDLTDDQKDNPIKDIFAQYSDCRNDRIYTFATNRRYTFVKGGNDALACKETSDSEGTWTFFGEVLNLASDCTVMRVNIDLNEDESMFSLTDDYDIKDVMGNLVRAKVTFTYSLK